MLMTEFFYNPQLCREGRVLCSTESHFLFVKDVLDLFYSGSFLFTALERGSENTKKTRRLAKEEIKEQLIDSITISNVIQIEELNEKTVKVESPVDAAAIIKEFEEIIRTKRKGIISVAYHQGKVFSRFRETEKFMKLVSEFRLHKNTIILKINIFKLIDKYPKLMK